MTARSGTTRVFTIAILLCTALSPATAQQRGDEIEFIFRGTRYQGTVMEVQGRGAGYIVRVIENGQPKVMAIPARSVREAEEMAEDAATSKDSPTGPLGGSSATGQWDLTIDLPKPGSHPPGRDASTFKLFSPSVTTADAVDERFHRFPASGPMTVNGPRERDTDRPVLLSFDPASIIFSTRSGWTEKQPHTTLYVVSCDGSFEPKQLHIGGARVAVWSSDPASGRVLGVVFAAGNTKPSGLCVLEGLLDSSPRVAAIWNLRDDTNSKPHYVSFRKLANERTAVITHGDRVRVFDVESQQEVWSAELAAFAEPAVSPGGAMVAFRNRQNVYAIMETATGKPLGAIPVEEQFPSSLAFSPDGTMLAIASERKLRICSLNGGRQVFSHDANVKLSWPGRPLIWPYKRYLLSSTGLLFDLSKNLICWNYGLSSDDIEFCDRIHSGLFGFANREAASVVRVPHEEAARSVRRDLSDLVALGEGDAVRIELTIEDDVKADANQLKENLAEGIRASGYTVDPNADTLVRVVMGRSKQQELNYLIFGFGVQEKLKVLYSGYFANLTVEQNGEVLFKKQSGSAMGTPSPRSRGTITVVEQPYPKKFKNERLPMPLLKKDYQNGFGSSRVRLQGIQ